MFRRISHIIALQFTGFVFLLLLANGAIFLAADLANSRREMHDRLFETSQFVLERAQRGGLDRLNASLLPAMRERVRVVDGDGAVLYGGALFADVPFSPAPDLTRAAIGSEQYTILTAQVRHEGQIVGWIQVADLDRLPLQGLPRRALLSLLVSIAVSALTFAVGLFFARRSLKPAERMVAQLEQFTQDASHELRTPLAALTSSLDLALKTGAHREGILSAKQDIREISALTERLLELARLEKFLVDRQTVDLAEVVRSACDAHRAAAVAKGVVLETEFGEIGEIRVRGDTALLRQAVSNLIGNAVKFNRPGGMVRVRLTEKLLEVADTGIGISAADLPRIFDRFYQADASRAKEGFGLGLSLVKKIVELHGWRIEAESRVGEGTRFLVHLGRLKRTEGS